jgi:hypothetical protein
VASSATKAAAAAAATAAIRAMRERSLPLLRTPPLVPVPAAPIAAASTAAAAAAGGGCCCESRLRFCTSRPLLRTAAAPEVTTNPVVA